MLPLFPGARPRGAGDRQHDPRPGVLRSLPRARRRHAHRRPGGID